MVILVSGGGYREPGRILETRIPMDDERYVWIVHYDNYGDTWISGVFDSEDKAQRYMDEHDPPGLRRPEWNCDYKMEKTRLY